MKNTFIIEHFHMTAFVMSFDSQWLSALVTINLHSMQLRSPECFLCLFSSWLLPSWFVFHWNNSYIFDLHFLGCQNLTFHLLYDIIDWAPSQRWNYNTILKYFWKWDISAPTFTLSLLLKIVVLCEKKCST